MTTWINLIVGHEQANPLTLKPHPLNFYTHPMQQRKVVSAAIEDIGYIDEVVVNRRTGHTLNGHLRVELAIGNGEATIPITILDCDEATENQILLFFDRIGEQAKAQGDRVMKLAAQVDLEIAPLQDMLDEWVSTFETFNRPKPAAVAAAPVAQLAPAAARPVVTVPVDVPLESLETPLAPVAGAAPTVIATTSAPPPEASQETAHVDTDSPAELASGPSPAPEPAHEAPASEGAAAAAAALVPAQDAPGPADNYEAALIEDGGAPIVALAPPAPTPLAVVAKPVVVKIGEYAQEFPADVFNAWWALLRNRVGDDRAAICSEIRTLLSMAEDPQ